MAETVRKFFGLKADSDDERRVLAIMQFLGPYANASDALRAALDCFVRKNRLDWQSVQLVNVKRK